MAKRLAAHFPKLKQLAYRFLGKVTCKHVTWKTEFGTGDAAKTAQLAGLIWTIKSMCLGWVQTKVNWKGEKKTGSNATFSNERISNVSIVHSHLYIVARYDYIAVVSNQLQKKLKSVLNRLQVENVILLNKGAYVKWNILFKA